MNIVEEKLATVGITCAPGIPACDISPSFFSPLKDVPKPKKKRDKTMYYVDNETDIVAQQKEHLLRRVRDIRCDKAGELEKVFHLYDDPMPTSPEELIERIMAGRFKIDPKPEKTRYDYSPLGRIIWRDPKEERDEAGFEAAMEKVNAAEQKVVDTIWVYDAETGLKAVEDFQAQTFH